MFNFPTPTRALPFAEFIALTALMVSLVAISIDALMPAFPDISKDFAITRDNDRQFLISSLLLALGLGQLFYGPLSDSIGRKPAIYIGYVLFLMGSGICIFATEYWLLLAGRFLQGLGVAGPRVVTNALIRDLFSGRAMARVMSFVMVVFVIAPAIGPIIGQGILFLAPWRWIFVSIGAVALITACWFAIRQPETLDPSKRIKLEWSSIKYSVREVLRSRIAMGYTLMTGLLFGAFLGYLNTVQQIIGEQYEQGTRFPLYFACSALAIGAASWLNGSLVMRLGMQRLTSVALFINVCVSSVCLLLLIFVSTPPPLWLFMLYTVVSLFLFGVMVGNLNALAMEPLGHVAGMGAAMIGSFSTLLSVSLGLIIGFNYQGTVTPVIAGFAVLGAFAIVVMLWTEAQRPLTVDTGAI